MKIGIIHHQYARKGGMERYIFDLLHDFGSRGDQVDLFVYKKEFDLAVPHHCQVHHKNLQWLPRKWRKYFFAYSMAKKKLDYDLLLSTMRSFSQDINICGGTHPGFLEFTGRRKKLVDRLEIAAEKRGFLNSKIIVAHSNLIRDEIIRYYDIPSEKIIRLFPPVNTDVFNLNSMHSRVETQKKFQINPAKCTLLFPSTGHKRKGLYELLEAFKALSDDYQLLIAGRHCDEAASMSNVRSLGFVENMSELYAAVDGVILPSHYEPFGLVVTEALACGTPVIISKWVGAKDVVDQDSGIILADISPLEIRMSIESFKSKHFVIEPEFISKYNLGLSAHLDQLVNLKGVLYG